MNIFGKKTSKEVAVVPANTAAELSAAELWKQHAELKAKKHQLGKELDEIEAKLLKLAKVENLFKGKTAVFWNGRRIRMSHSAKVLTGEKFDLGGFSDSYPHLCKVELRDTEIAKIFQDADKAKGLQALGLDVEVKTYYKFE